RARDAERPRRGCPRGAWAPGTRSLRALLLLLRVLLDEPEDRLPRRIARLDHLGEDGDVIALRHLLNTDLALRVLQRLDHVIGHPPERGEVVVGVEDQE